MKRFAQFALSAATVTAVVLSHSTVRLFPFALAIPVVYLIVNRLVAGVRFEQTVSRAYLMYFLMELTGMLLQAEELGYRLQNEMNSISDPQATLLELISELPEILTRTLMPLACGVAVYIIFGNSSEVSAEAARSAHDGRHAIQLTELLQNARVPEAVAQLMTDLVSQIDAINSACRNFTHVVGTSAKDLQNVGAEAGTAAHSLNVLAQQIAALKDSLQTIRAAVAETGNDIQGLRKIVSEIGEVVSEFSEIAASRILKFSREMAHAE